MPVSQSCCMRRCIGQKTAFKRAIFSESSLIQYSLDSATYDQGAITIEDEGLILAEGAAIGHDLLVSLQLCVLEAGACGRLALGSCARWSLVAAVIRTTIVPGV